MRGSDVVDLLAEVLPPSLVKTLIGAVAVGVTGFGFTAPIDWYIADKAAGIQEMFTEYVEAIVTDYSAPAAP
ncbi:hypothetical protein [Demequina sp. NBRC 110055]|uniref:hypothetical protein n=1 Tax=Demequina sp. NBRC 110055 TaxID=1570344 RepID=UPI0009FC8701|nr:hypothetical protein [Demequina sp. NBRC 110055]